MRTCKLIKKDTFRDIQFEYVFEDDHSLVGMLEIRIKMNEYIERYMGHIGYFIVVHERNKGYATRLLSEGLQQCRNLGMQEVILVCERSNVPSKRVIEKNGGIYLETVYEKCKAVYLERYKIVL